MEVAIDIMHTCTDIPYATAKASCMQLFKHVVCNCNSVCGTVVYSRTSHCSIFSTDCFEYYLHVLQPTRDIVSYDYVQL